MMVRYVNKGEPVDKLPLNSIVGYCEKCGRPLAIRKGKYGKYIYCKNIDCHTTIPITDFVLMDKDCIDLFNLKRAETNKDIDKAREILMTCSSMVKVEAEWSVDRIYKKILENSPHYQKEDMEE